MSYAAVKRENARRMNERIERMKEENARAEAEAFRRRKLRENHERKLAKKKAEEDAIDAVRIKKELEEKTRLKLGPGNPGETNVDDTSNLYFYDGTCLNIPWDTLPKPLVRTVRQLMDVLALHFEEPSIINTCGPPSPPAARPRTRALCLSSPPRRDLHRSRWCNLISQAVVLFAQTVRSCRNLRGHRADEHLHPAAAPRDHRPCARIL